MLNQAPPDQADLSKEVRDLIHQIIHAVGETPHGDLIADIIATALRLIPDQTDRGDLKIIQQALKELRDAARMFAPYRAIRKVTVFGSARTPEWDVAYLQAVSFAREITGKGFMVITGAGEGIMKGGQQGAGRGNSFGINIRLPFEQTPNVYIRDDNDKLMTFKYFFTRKLTFIKETHALVLFPGGFGTHDEGFEILTLLQTGKSTPLPVIFLDTPGGVFWQKGHDYVERQLLDRGMIDAEDMHLFKVTDRVEEAVREIVTFYAQYHSMRYVGDRLIVRLQRPISQGFLSELNDRFSDILIRGVIQTTTPLPEEANEPAIRHLPRLSLEFNRRNHGRLRQLIDLLNARALEGRG